MKWLGIGALVNYGILHVLYNQLVLVLGTCSASSCHSHLSWIWLTSICVFTRWVLLELLMCDKDSGYCLTPERKKMFAIVLLYYKTRYSAVLRTWLPCLKELPKPVLELSDRDFSQFSQILSSVWKANVDFMRICSSRSLFPTFNSLSCLEILEKWLYAE